MLLFLIYITNTFGIKADTPKSDIGKYFTAIEKTMTLVKEKLQAEVAQNGNYVKVKTVIDKFIAETLDKISEGAKTAASGATGDGKIGDAVAGQNAIPADANSVNALVKGVKTIVDIVLKKGEGDAGATKTGDSEKQSIGKLFGQGSGGSDGDETHAAAASASIGAVTGTDILQAIANSGDTTSAATIATAKHAADIAAAKQETSQIITTTEAKKDAVIAAGIALRAIAKSGKFTVKIGEDKSANAINGAAANAVNKVLSTLIIAIRNTVDSGLKTISETLATVKQGNVSGDTGESGVTK
ncbi:Variable outer membrane protein (plasmid) [Borrelia coriaceae ATCC 43381]|uniref:Variable large protein n=1 Tax=Borrelia coriaceae ATCC 43381 TaxID=1408429 RepID=W5T1U6_9SPIR|nr:Variable outer membrane protein [Borrelia coriaceae ATCC 43381]